jgi:hypothetical protein
MVVHRFDDMTLGDEEDFAFSPPVPVAGAIDTSIFSSPLSTNGSTGGVSLGSRVGGVKLLFCESAASLCGGEIRGSEGNRFCSRSKDACLTEVHKVKKVALAADVFYIRAGKQDQVRLKPILAEAEIPINMTKAKLLGKRQEVDVWVTYFNAVREREQKEAEGVMPGSSHGTTDSWAKVMVPTHEELSQA